MSPRGLGQGARLVHGAPAAFSRPLPSAGQVPPRRTGGPGPERRGEHPANGPPEYSARRTPPTPPSGHLGVLHLALPPFLSASPQPKHTLHVHRLTPHLPNPSRVACEPDASRALVCLKDPFPPAPSPVLTPRVPSRACAPARAPSARGHVPHMDRSQA